MTFCRTGSHVRTLTGFWGGLLRIRWPSCIEMPGMQLLPSCFQLGRVLQLLCRPLFRLLLLAGADDKWVRIEPAGEHLRGASVRFDGSEVLRGDVGLKLVDGKWIAIRRMRQSDIADFCGAEAAADAAILGIKFQGIKREERTWRNVSHELVEEVFQDWGAPGPRTSVWCVRFLNRQRSNGSPQVADARSWSSE